MNALKLLTLVLLAGAFPFSSFAASNTAPTEKSLYETMASLERNSCGAGTCWAELSQLTCTWANEEGNNHQCTYKTEKGDTKIIHGKKAVALTKALQKIKTLDVSCGAGTCGFRFPQDVTCASREGYKKHPVVCSVHPFEKSAADVEKIPVPTSKPAAPASR